MYRFRAFLALSVIAAATATAPAKAEIEIYKKDGWSFSTNGRANGFYSYEWGDYKPTGGTPLPNGMLAPTVQDSFSAAPDDVAQTKFSVSRIQTGFVGSILGFTIAKEITPTLRASAHMELWTTIETDQFKGYSSMGIDPREDYVKLEGTWGAVEAGRKLGFHNRGATLTDFLYANGYSVGSFCNATLSGPQCGNIGYGYQFPGYNAFLGYETPKVGGFQMIIGAFDPVRIGLGGVELHRVHVPRVESEATYDYAAPSGNFKLSLYVNGMWQTASDTVNDQEKKVNAVGVGAGFRIEAAKIVKIGIGVDKDVGGGDGSALVGPVPIDAAGNLRHTDGALAQVMVSPGPFDIAAGAGVTRVQETATDLGSAADLMSVKSPIKSRLGMNLTFNYHIDPVVFNAQFFQARREFWRGDHQKLTAVHTGMTFVW